MQEIAAPNSPIATAGRPRLEIRNLGIPLVSVMDARRAKKRRARRGALLVAALLMSVGCLGLAFVK